MRTLFVAFTLALIVSAGVHADTPKEWRKIAQTAVKVSAEKLIQDYIDDGDDANQKYRGQWLQIRGSISQKFKTSDGTPFILVGAVREKPKVVVSSRPLSPQQLSRAIQSGINNPKPKGPVHSIQFVFAPNQWGALANMKPGDPVIVIGYCPGYAHPNVSIKDFHFLTATEMAEVERAEKEAERARKDAARKEHLVKVRPKAEKSLAKGKAYLSSGKQALKELRYNNAVVALNYASNQLQVAMAVDDELPESVEAKSLFKEAKNLLTQAKAEAAAASKLKLALELLEEGKLDRGKERLRELTRQYPDTAAAKEAKKHLDRLDGK